MARITPRRLSINHLALPLFFKLEVQPEVIRLDVYEPLVTQPGTDALIGAVSRAPVLPVSAQAQPQAPQASTPYAGSARQLRTVRVAIDGGTVDPRHAGVPLCHLGFSRLFNERVYGEQKVNLGPWELADSLVYGLFVDREGYPVAPLCVTEDQVNRKAGAFRSAEILGATPVAVVFRPFVGDDFTQCSISMRFNETLGFAANLAPWEPIDDLGVLAPLMLPGISVAHAPLIAPGGTEVVTVKLTDRDTGALLEADCELFLEATGATCPRSASA